MANVDFSAEIRDFKTAALGEDVRDSLVAIAEKLEDTANDTLVTADTQMKVVGENSSSTIWGDSTKHDVEVNDIQAEVNAIKAAVGSPLVVSTKAAMTDHDKVYVYVGYETGMTNGNWYYYNGTDFVSGGVYQSQGLETDKTLSVENMAADAKYTGDAVNGLKSALHYSDLSDTRYIDSILCENTNISFEQGAFNSTNPDVPSDYSVRTGAVEGNRYIINPGKQLAYMTYLFESDGTYVKYMPGADPLTGTTGFYLDEIMYLPKVYNGRYYRIRVRQISNAGIKISPVDNTVRIYRELADYPYLKPIRHVTDGTNNTAYGLEIASAIIGFYISFDSPTEESAFWGGTHTKGSTIAFRNFGPAIYKINNGKKQLVWYWVQNNGKFISSDSAFTVTEDTDVDYIANGISFHRFPLKLDGYYTMIYVAIDWNAISSTSSSVVIDLYYDKDTIPYEKQLLAFSAYQRINHGGLNFGVDGDSITAGKQWSDLVRQELNYSSWHNVAVPSAQWQDEIITYNGTEYRPQIYGESGWLGMSGDSGTIPDATEAQKRANNSAKNHVLQFIAEVNNGDYPAPDVFVFALGTNDDTARLGTVEEAFASPTLPAVNDPLLEKSTGAMRWCIQKLKQTYPRCKIYWSTPIQSSNETRQAKNLIRIPVMTEVANLLSVEIIDQFNNSGISALMETAIADPETGEGFYLVDGTHTTTEGEKAMAECALTVLSRYKKIRSLKDG